MTKNYFLKLSNSQKKELLVFMKTTKDKEEYRRASAVKQKMEGIPYRSIARNVGVNYRNVYDWINKYFWIIALGVVTSRIFSITGGGTLGSASIKFDVGELIWIPSSAIITLLIFSSFLDQVDLTNDIMLNLALAFGFGFGFDKVLEAWKKAPSRSANT